MEPLQYREVGKAPEVVMVSAPVPGLLRFC